MKFIQTLFIDKDPFKNSFGWAAPEYHLMSWVFSSLQLQKIYLNVELFANSRAAELLIDILDLPYSKVNITHDNLKLANDNLWALPKVFTYSLQGEPFVHIDGDVFLFDQLPKALIKSELIAQNIEEATDYYMSTQKELMAEFTYFPPCVQNDFFSLVPIRAVNAGILGVNNISFIKEYTSLAFEYIARNLKHLSSIQVDRFNVFFEQHLFYSLAKEKNILIGVLFDDVINDNEYKYIGNIHEAPCCRRYFHLLGQFKKDEYTCRQMATKLLSTYPEYYYKIVSLFKEQNSSFLSFYSKLDIRTSDDFLVYNKEACKNYCNTKENKSNNSTEIEEGQTVSEMELLQTILEHYINEHDNSISLDDLQDDFKTFAASYQKILKNSGNDSLYWLYGRDLDAANWYCEIFGSEPNILNNIIVKCSEVNVVESEFDWAGLINKYTRIGVRYYDTLELAQGAFYNLFVPEIPGNKFSLFDLDETEKLILERLDTPLSINQLLLEMQDYAEEEVIRDHLEIFNTLILSLLKQLVVKKAIKPFKKV